MTPFARFAAAALCGTSGLLVLVALTIGGSTPDHGLFVAVALGAFLGGLACAGLFGHPSHRGIALAILGAVLVSAIAGLLVGFAVGATLGEPLGGLLMGPLGVGFALVKSPVALAVWVGTMSVIHLSMRRLRLAG